MAKRILLSLLTIAVLLLPACQSPTSTSVPAESFTNPSPETDNNPTPIFSPIPNNDPLPPATDTAHWKVMQYYVHDGFSFIKSWPLIMDSVHTNSDGSYTQLFQKLAGAYLIARQQYPTIRDDIAKVLERTRPDLLDSLNEFFDTVEGVEKEHPDTAKAWAQQVQAELGFTANSPAPTLYLDVTAPQTGIVFNPIDSSDQTIINLYLSNPVEQSYLNGLTAEVNGSVFDANTWQVQPEDKLEVTGPITLSEQDQKTPNSPYYYQFNIPVHGAVDWANVVLKKNGQVVGYGLNVKSPLGFPHLMTMRPMTVTEEGRNLLPSDTWGSPELTPTSAITTSPDQLEAQMRQELSDDLDKAVAVSETSDYGISRDKADELLGEYDDPQLAYLSPPLRAGLLLASSIKQAGGEMILPALGGAYDNNIPVENYFIDDPALAAVLAKHNTDRSDIKVNANTVRGFVFYDDHTRIIVWGTGFHNESIEAMASLAAHELLVHTDLDVSYPEEVFANYVQTLTWAILLNRDLANWDSNSDGPPPIFQDVTTMERFNNELWLALFNTLYISEDGSPSLSYIGLMSRITGEQTHDQKTYNVLLGSTESYTSFYDMIDSRYKGWTDNSWPDYSPGTEKTRQLFMAMFNLSDQESDQLLASERGLGHLDNTTGHYDPDYSELLFSDVMDKLAHQPFSDEMVIRVAQALHATLDGSSATP